MNFKGIMGIPSKPAFRSHRNALTKREIAARKRVAEALLKYYDEPFGAGCDYVTVEEQLQGKHPVGSRYNV